LSKYLNIDDSIEGLSILLYTRKYVSLTPIKKNGIGILFKYRCQINASAEILKELEKKECKFKKGCYLNKHDSLEAERIEIYCLNSINFSKEANYSSTHGIQRAKTKDFTHAVVSIPFRYILERRRIEE
jgi:hypothetical protein